MAKQENGQFIDELMGFNPNEVTAFNAPKQKSAGNIHQYKTNPLKVDSKIAPDGHYHAKIRIVYNPHNMKESIVNTAHYAFNDMDGFFMLDSKLTIGDRNCPMFKAWKALHYNQSTDKFEVDGKLYTAKEWGDHMFDKSEEQFVLVQIIEDANQPELVGKFMGWRLPKTIFDILNSKMNPTDESKAPQDLMNYLFGPILELDVTPGPEDPANPERRQREIKYTLCAFETDPTPIISVTGEDLFNEDERDMINDYATAKKVITDPKASAKKKDEAKAKCKSLVEPLKALMQKALDYVKENAIDIVEEFGYKEPTAEQWARFERWNDIVSTKKQNPMTYVEPTTATSAGEKKEDKKPEETTTAPQEPATTTSTDDDLPF